MLIRIAFDIALSAPAPVPVVLALSPRPEEMGRISAGPLRLASDGGPAPEPRWFRDGFGNARARLVMPAGRLRLAWDGVATDSGAPDPVSPGAAQHAVEDLPDEVLPFLAPSRYVESDLLSQEAWDRFGPVAPGWDRAQAACDFVHGRVRFDYAAASPLRTAAGALAEGQGVCRDYAHLLLAFLRALNIPARYASGFLGDIDWPDMGPGDFCAWCEAFLGGRWHTLDARYNRPRVGRIVMARGRDAADVPIVTSFGPTRLEAFEVHCDEIKGQLAAAE